MLKFLKIKNLNVELGSELRRQIDKEIENEEIRICNLKLLNRTFRLLKLTILNAPKQVLFKEIELIESAVIESRIAYNK